MKNIAKSMTGAVLAKTVALVAVVCLVETPFAYADEDHFRGGRCYPIDLRSGVVTPPPRFIEFVVLPEDSNHDGWHETVLKITLNDPHARNAPEAARFFIRYDGDPTGMTVNIGDSKSNNGGAGDSGDQSNDAELQIGSVDVPSSFDDLSVFGHDGVLEARGTQQIDQVFNIAKKGETPVLTISNERLGYQNKAFPISGDIRSTWLYALNGQPDTEGPVNYDIYASFNRVIDGYRMGSGVGKVTVCLLRDLVCEEDDKDCGNHHGDDHGK